jgi:hypothetical protein
MKVEKLIKELELYPPLWEVKIEIGMKIVPLNSVIEGNNRLLLSDYIQE